MKRGSLASRMKKIRMVPWPTEMWVNFSCMNFFVQGLRDLKTDFMVFVFLFIGVLRKRKIHMQPEKGNPSG